MPEAIWLGSCGSNLCHPKATRSFRGWLYPVTGSDLVYHWIYSHNGDCNSDYLNAHVPGVVILHELAAVHDFIFKGGNLVGLMHRKEAAAKPAYQVMFKQISKAAAII